MVLPIWSANLSFPNALAESIAALRESCMTSSSGDKPTSTVVFTAFFSMSISSGSTSTFTSSSISPKSTSTSTSTSAPSSPKDVKTNQQTLKEFKKQCIEEVKNMSKNRVYKTIKDIVGQFQITDL